MAIFNKGYDGGSNVGGSSNDTVIAQGVRVEGEFVSDGNVIIEGEVRGAVATSQHLAVGEHAKIVADVQAGTAMVAGLVEGNIRVTGRLELKSTSHIIGDITADDLVIESGAVLNGRIAMKQPEGAVAPMGKKKHAKEEELLATEAVEA